MAIPQLILFLDADGSLRAEEPSASGARRKIDLGADALHYLPSSLVSALLEQRDRIAANAAREREIDKREAAQRAQRVFARVWRDHDSNLAAKVNPTLAAKFKIGERVNVDELE
jgi:hypothetical protein